MKYGIEFHCGGALFSKFLILLNNLDMLEQQGRISLEDELYIDSRYRTGNRFKKLKPRRDAMSGSKYNIFDHVLEQTPEGVDETLLTKDLHVKVHSNSLKAVADRYKLLSGALLHINKEVQEKVDLFMADNFEENMVGVHVRMTDLNTWAAGHKTRHVTDSDYFNKIDELLAEGNATKLFVASDNTQMLEKLAPRYDICFYDMKHRRESEHVTKKTYETEFRTKKGWVDWPPEFYVEAMIDSLLLSYCHTLIARRSAVNFVSRVYEWSKVERYYALDE